MSPDPGCEALRQPNHLYSRAEILARQSPVPDVPGVYGWYFYELPAGIEANRCVEFQGRRLLYVGIAPRAPGRSKATLRSRLRNHYRGNAEGSTLRLTLGCLLGLELRRVGGGTVMTFGKAEADLSGWMTDNAFVTWIEDPLRKALRAEINDEAWASLYRTTSRPFPKPETGKIAVKVISHYGDEVMKVYEVT